MVSPSEIIHSPVDRVSLWLALWLTLSEAKAGSRSPLGHEEEWEQKNGEKQHPEESIWGRRLGLVGHGETGGFSWVLYQQLGLFG
jgi:phosphoglycerate dehydrogenase-like enzyme